MKTGGRVAFALLVTLFGVVVVRNAWIHDDAYITFRTVDNFVSGYGLRWNPAERVQTYTHPLWMFVVTAAYLLTHEVFFTVIALSVALSVATVVLVFELATSLAAGCVGVLILTCSKAYVDYSSSGLENPLTHLLYAAFLAAYFRRDASVRTVYVLASLAALGAVNRLDTLLLFLPVLVVALSSVGIARGSLAIAAGFAPLLLWEAFSLFYYGFPFPNTAYAKLFETGVGGGERVMHGLYFLQNSARLDPLTLSTIAVASVAAVWSRDRRQLAVIGGVAAYLSYIVYIGGDFITGRFIAAPLLGASVLLSQWRPLSRTAFAAAAAAAIVVVVALTASESPLFSTADAGSQGKQLMDAHGIADERAYYYPYAGFLRALQHVSIASHPWALEGLDARRRRVPIAVRGDIGYFGFYAGPQVHIVDLWGLADPLIARLPARTDVPWRIGHFTRAIPDGYLQTLTTGHNAIADGALAAYYDRLALITRGPLFDRKRLVEIWNVNVGN